MTDAELDACREMAARSLPPTHRITRVVLGFVTGYDGCREFIEFIVHIDGDAPKPGAWEVELENQIRKLCPRDVDPVLVLITTDVEERNMTGEGP